MLRVIGLLVVGACTATAGAQAPNAETSPAAARAAAGPTPVWTAEGWTYPEGAVLPRGLTDWERAWLEEHPIVPDGGLRGAAIPTGPVYCPPEYAPMEGLIIAWEAFTPILTDIAEYVTNDGPGKVYVVCDTGSEQNSAQTTLTNGGVDMGKVEFLVRTTDSVWCRDYGPRYIYEGDCRAIVDHTYNRPRPNDNAFPQWLAGQKNQARYTIPLVHGGGNFHLDAPGFGYTTRLITQENPGLTEPEIHALWASHQNLDTLFFDRFPPAVDSTGHIDMWMQLISDDEVIISYWPTQPTSTQAQICDQAAAQFAARGYTVYRTPALRASGTHFTFTNVVMCNDVVIIPRYNTAAAAAYNDEALGVFAAALPDKTIRQITADQVAALAGVLHCIVMHVPAPLGGKNPTAYLRNLRGGEALEPGSPVTIEWISDDDEAVTSVDLLLSTDGGATFPTTIVAGAPDNGAYEWIVPDVYTTQARVRIVVHDGAANSGSDESDADFTINGTPTCPGDTNGDNTVNVTDLGALLGNFGVPSGATLADGDLDGDGDVDVTDLGFLLNVFGTSCP